MLYIVATPIGNLKDITLRALELLKSVDGIICEDSRRTSILLNYYQIARRPLLVLNDYNEAKAVPAVVSQLQAGVNLALVSDAGTPLISDPGFKLVRECLENNIEVDSIPGPSSVLVALTLSGLPPDKFLFLGYLPEKQGKRLELYRQVVAIATLCQMTFIAFVSPHKITKDLEDIQRVLGDIEVVLTSELTKIHQSVDKKPISQWLDEFSKKKVKGELVLLFRLD